MARAQMNIGVDVNAQPAKKKLNDLKKEGVDTVEELGAKNRESIKGLIGMFAPMALAISGIMMAFGAIKSAIADAFSQGKVFQDFAEKTNLSAESMAHLKAVADAAGISTKEFEQAMDDLANGKTSLRMLQEEWSKLGDSITAAENSQKNFIELGKTRNVEEYKKRWSGVWSDISGWVVRQFGSGFFGEQEAIMESAAYSGKSYDEAYKDVINFVRSQSGVPIAEEASLRTAYDWAIAKKYQDERESRRAFQVNVAKQVMSSGLDDESKVALFRQETDANFSLEAIKALADETKTREERINEEIKRIEEEKKRIEEERKKAEEDRKKAEDERKKIEDERKKAEDDYLKALASSKLPREVIEKLYKNELGESVSYDTIKQRARDAEGDRERRLRELREEEEKYRKEEERLKKINEDIKKREEELRKEESAYIDSFTKSAWGIKDVWTDGGGLIGNVNYGLRNQKATDEQIKLAHQQLKQAINQSKYLKEIEGTLKGDK